MRKIGSPQDGLPSSDTDVHNNDLRVEKACYSLRLRINGRMAEKLRSLAGD